MPNLVICEGMRSTECPFQFFLVFNNSRLWCKEMEKCSFKTSSTDPEFAPWCFLRLIGPQLRAFQFMLWAPSSRRCTYEVSVCFVMTSSQEDEGNPQYDLRTSRAGDQDSGCAASSEAGSQLFIFRFGESDIIRRWIVSLPDSPRQLNTPSYETLEDSCNLYLQQRYMAIFYVYLF